MENFELSEALKGKLENAESVEEVIRACAEEGIEITAEDLAGAAVGAELDENALDNVSGGGNVALTAMGVIGKLWYEIQSRRNSIPLPNPPKFPNPKTPFPKKRR